MPKFVLTKVTPDYDPGVYVVQNFAFQSIYKLTEYAAGCLRRLTSFEVNQVVDRHHKELCSYNFFNNLGLMFSEDCPYCMKYNLSLVSKTMGIYSFSNEDIKEGPAE